MSEAEHLTRAPSGERRGMSRRQFMAAGGTLAAGGTVAAAINWWQSRERGMRAQVCIAKAAHYSQDLAAVVGNGLAELGVTRDEIRGKRIVLKPNLVETSSGHRHINTHPAVVVAVAETFRRMDAADVIIAEGQGHRRDSWLVLDESGLMDALDEARLPFVDLNHDDVERVPNTGGWTQLDLYLPKTILAADLVVSLPKLKTHHWTGVTCAMKNLFGVMPGVVYGWPKNPLHFAGIEKSILDINAAVHPGIAIVDGILGMEGDGPIMGEPKKAGVLVMGRSLPAVDATCVRVMGLEPQGVRYLAGASGRLGPILEDNITQVGESIASVRTSFRTLDLPHLDPRLRGRHLLA